MLIAGTADEELGLVASGEKGKVVVAIVDGSNGNTDSNGGLHACICAGWAEAYRGTKGKACKNDGQMKFAVKPIKGCANVVLLSDAVVMLSLTENGATEVETEHGKSE